MLSPEGLANARSTDRWGTTVSVPRGDGGSTRQRSTPMRFEPVGLGREPLPNPISSNHSEMSCMTHTQYPLKRYRAAQILQGVAHSNVHCFILCCVGWDLSV